MERYGDLISSGLGPAVRGNSFGRYRVGCVMAFGGLRFWTDGHSGREREENTQLMTRESETGLAV